MSNQIVSLPKGIVDAITSILSTDEKRRWLHRAERLHERYFSASKEIGEDYIQDELDALSYLALRIPATYAQIYGSLLQVREMVPDWKPQSVLDIGSGPGVGVWVTKEVFPSITNATCIDKNEDLLSFGKAIAQKAEIQEIKSLLIKDIRYGLGIDEEEEFDIVIISSVLNELSEEKGEQLLRRAYQHCRGILLIVEPGTEKGNEIVSRVAKVWSKEATLLAPYIDSTFVSDEKMWIHFSQRFFRPPFQRSLRQKMRQTSEMASDWEDAKYSYVAISKIPHEYHPWGRTIGSPKLQKGFLTIPVLTKNRIEEIKVLKRHKKAYNLAKELSWGDTVDSKENILTSE